MALSQELRYRIGLQIGHEVPRRALGQESNGVLNSRREFFLSPYYMTIVLYIIGHHWPKQNTNQRV